MTDSTSMRALSLSTFVVPLLLISPGCHHAETEEDAHLAFVKADPWYSPYPFDVLFSLDKSTEVPFWEVAVSSFRYVQSVLVDKQIVPIKELVVSDLIPHVFGTKGISVPEGNELYLVRAVYLVPETGGFSVYLEDGKLLVDHSCLGKHAEPMKRSALVVALPGPPKTVYVECQMAE